MKTYRLCLLLVLAAALVSGSSAQSTNVKNTRRPGLFYVFADGQIVVIDAVAQKIVKTIEAPVVPFPNGCNASAYQGTWSDGVVASGKIFAAARYGTTAAPKPAGVSDALYVLDTKQQKIVQRVPVSTAPVHVYYVPYLGEVWSHSDGTGTFDVVNTYNYSLLYSNVEAHVNISGHGKLLFDDNLGSVGYATNVNEPGILELDLETLEPDSIPFVNLTGQPLPNGNTSLCTGTHSIAYSALNNHAYVECVAITNQSAPGPNFPVLSRPGIIEVDLNNNTVVNQLSYTGHCAVSPDYQYLAVTDSVNASIHIVKITPVGQPDLYFDVPLVDAPGEQQPAWYPANDSYTLAVPLINTPYLALVDFAGVVRCNGNCTTAQQKSFLTYANVGNQNPPGKPNNLTTSRSVDAGYRYICTPSIADNAVGCYDTVSKNVTIYGGIKKAQRVYFAEGSLSGPADPNANGVYDCARAQLAVVPTNSLAPIYNGTAITKAGGSP